MSELSSPVFRVETVAEPADIDELGHVSNTVYVRWIVEAAAAHSATVGWPWAAYRARGVVFMVRRHEIDYLQQARAGDRIAIDTWVDSWKAVSSIRCATVRRLDDHAVLARARTQWVFVSLRSGRPQRIPDEVRAAFTADAPPG